MSLQKTCRISRPFVPPYGKIPISSQVNRGDHHDSRVISCAEPSRPSCALPKARSQSPACCSSQVRPFRLYLIAMFRVCGGASRFAPICPRFFHTLPSFPPQHFCFEIQIRAIVVLPSCLSHSSDAGPNTLNRCPVERGNILRLPGCDEGSTDNCLGIEPFRIGICPGPFSEKARTRFFLHAPRPLQSSSTGTVVFFAIEPGAADPSCTWQPHKCGGTISTPLVITLNRVLCVIAWLRLPRQSVDEPMS